MPIRLLRKWIQIIKQEGDENQLIRHLHVSSSVNFTILLHYMDIWLKHLLVGSEKPPPKKKIQPTTKFIQCLKFEFKSELTIYIHTHTHIIQSRYPACQQKTSTNNIVSSATKHKVWSFYGGANIFARVRACQAFSELIKESPLDISDIVC